MRTSITNVGIRSMIWYCNKLLRVSLEGLFVDNKSLGRVKDLISDGSRVVLLPIYKSYADFFIQTYIF
jgi:hypothetical protein